MPNTKPRRCIDGVSGATTTAAPALVCSERVVQIFVMLTANNNDGHLTSWLQESVRNAFSNAVATLTSLTPGGDLAPAA